MVNFCILPTDILCPAWLHNYIHEAGYYVDGANKGNKISLNCGNGVALNGKTAKPSHDVKEGDIIEISFGQGALKVEVLSVAEHALKADAAGMYREIT